MICSYVCDCAMRYMTGVLRILCAGVVTLHGVVCDCDYMDSRCVMEHYDCLLWLHSSRAVIVVT